MTIQIEEQRRYVNGFIVLSYQRSGSTMLLNALARHSRIRAYSELFNLGELMLEPGKRYKAPWWLRLYRHYCPKSFLKRYIFGSYPDHIQAVGFKIFPEHVRDTRYARTLEFLRAWPSVHIIHLKRYNKLEAYLSRVRAEQTGVWSSASGQQTVDTVHLDPAACSRMFERREQDERYFDRIFNDQPSFMTVYYEDMNQNMRRELRVIQQFLGVDHEQIEPTLKKQQQKSLTEAIINYDELRRYFQHTRWADYFED